MCKGSGSLSYDVIHVPDTIVHSAEGQQLEHLHAYIYSRVNRVCTESHLLSNLHSFSPRWSLVHYIGLYERSLAVVHTYIYIHGT